MLQSSRVHVSTAWRMLQTLIEGQSRSPKTGPHGRPDAAIFEIASTRPAHVLQFNQAFLCH
jgi:hypothetical protein